MEVKVEIRKEGGWTVWFVDGKFNTMRYVLPEGEMFTVVNPFKIERSMATVADFDTAVAVATQSAENAKVEYDAKR